TPLRFANPSPPSGWIRDSHPQAVKHARHTKESRPPRDRLGSTPPSDISAENLVPQAQDQEAQAGKCWPRRLPRTAAVHKASGHREKNQNQEHRGAALATEESPAVAPFPSTFLRWFERPPRMIATHPAPLWATCSAQSRRAHLPNRDLFANAVDPFAFG